MPRSMQSELDREDHPGRDRPALLTRWNEDGGTRRREMLHIHVLGLASIASDVTPELARATIASLVVLGALHASPAVKAALADRMT